MVVLQIRKEVYLKAIKNNSLDNIHFYLGDSSRILPKLVKRFQQPVLFYLDAHRSRNKGKYNGFPIWQELKTIKKRDFKDIVVIDDVHAFGRKRRGKVVTWENLTVKTISNYLKNRITYLKIIDDTCTIWLKGN